MVDRIIDEDHEQRLLMDGVKNMLEAMIDEEDNIAQCYANSHQELTNMYKKYSFMNKKELIQERIYQNGYYPNEKVDTKLEKILDSMK
jgi:hypothetical protein